MGIAHRRKREAMCKAALSTRAALWRWAQPRLFRGNLSISVSNYGFLRKSMAVPRCHTGTHAIEVPELENLQALNFIIEGALGGGVTRPGMLTENH